jgi:hypothetical protein
MLGFVKCKRVAEFNVLLLLYCGQANFSVGYLPGRAELSPLRLLLTPLWPLLRAVQLWSLDQLRK